MEWATTWLAAWMERRRMAAVQRANARCSSKGLRAAAKLVDERSRKIETLSEQWAEAKDSLTAELAAVRSELEQVEHRAERLSRELELAKIENGLLVGIIERDRNRVAAETAIAVGKAEGIAAQLNRIVGDD